ncbi:MAG TPA: tetratricopeptide repeat protein [Gemmatimonadaceae bacterium]
MRALVVARTLMLACALPSSAVAMRAVPPCPTCGEAREIEAAPAIDTAYAKMVQRARRASQRGEWNEAADLWRDALLVDGRSAEHWLAWGDALSGAARHREAVAAYQRAIQLDARLTRQGTTSVARAFARMRDDRQAVRWLELALQAGVSPESVWSDDTFGAYRNDPRLSVPERVQVRGRRAKIEGNATT